MPTALILGANGRFGNAAARAFTAAGWRVVPHTRQSPADFSQPADVVVHALNPVYTRWKTEVMPLARWGMDIAQQLNATFMLPGNVYNFGEGMPAVLSTSTPERPSNEKGEIRRALEAEMRDRARRGLRSVVIRAGDFFGAGRGNWFDMAIVKSLAQGRLVYPGPLDVPHAWAYLPDLARAFVATAGRRDLPAFTRLHFGGHTLTGQQLLDAIERVVQPARPLRRGSLPWGAIRVGGLVLPMWRELAKMSYLWRVPHALHDDFGAPVTPLDTAVRAALQDLGLLQPASAPALSSPRGSA